MAAANRLGIDCGSISLNLVLLNDGKEDPVTVYRRTHGRPLQTFVEGVDELLDVCGEDILIESSLVTGSGRELLAEALEIPAINEITAHAAGVHRVDPRVRSVIEIGGQDSKFIRIEPDPRGGSPRFPVFRMNEICAAGTGAFLDEQSARLGIPVESFGEIALRSDNPAPIAGRCAVFAKTDMIHKAQEGTPIPDILMGLALALARNYAATLIRGDSLEPVVSLQGGVMSNAAVVRAFKTVLGLKDGDVVTPPYFTVLGALGCADLSRRQDDPTPSTLTQLKRRVESALRRPVRRSSLAPLDVGRNVEMRSVEPLPVGTSLDAPLVMGLDVGSVSVKGVIADAKGRVAAQDYRLSRSRPLETLRDVIEALLQIGPRPDLVAVTGSGRYLAGRLLEADLIVNEITAQARAALSADSSTDTVVEIGGQDSKWIALEEGAVRDFEMNRVCAAGTGSFLMEQADRLALSMGKEFSDSAFSSRAPADLGTRCTVFMESDLIHHQNNGASSEDLAAGVCVSVVHNYLERVANNRPLGDRIMFLGGVAALPAVRAAFERETGKRFHVPEIFKVSGALGAALKALDRVRTGDLVPRVRKELRFDPVSIKKEQFRCRGCPNQCFIDKYRPGDRIVFHGGLCDRWETEEGSADASEREDLFKFRTKLLEETARSGSGHGTKWGIIRTPQFYEWFPFWKAFCDELGIDLVPAPAPGRRQFERGTRFLRVETCLPIKVLAGQIADLEDAGIGTLFHPAILTEESPESSGDHNGPRWPREGSFVTHCPYVQASSQFFRGSFDVKWEEPVICYELDPDSFRREHIRLARRLGASRGEAADAFRAGLDRMRDFRERLNEEGERFLASLGEQDRALVVLGKPYHTSDPFLNMNLGSLCRRLHVPAIPADIFPHQYREHPPRLSWKHQSFMIRTAREIAGDPRLFPVLITFYGCGPDPFTLRHLWQSLEGKPLLLLEMDEHTSRAGVMTRIEAFLDRMKQGGKASGAYRGGVVLPPRAGDDEKGSALDGGSDDEETTENACLPFTQSASRISPAPGLTRSSPRIRADMLFMADMADHTFGFAAAARSVGVDARVLPPPDEESERLGRPHMVGGECHPYALVLGDYIKLAAQLPTRQAERSRFYMIGNDACRLQQYPVYIDKVRRELGYSIGVIGVVDEGLEAFGLARKYRKQVLVRAWEGLNAFDLLKQVYTSIRPVARDRALLEQAYAQARDNLFEALSQGYVRRGMEEALHELGKVPVDERSAGPLVAVAGDYYSRVVPFANNNVMDEIERLGGTLLYPPCFSDSIKLGTTRQFVWRLLGGQWKEAAADGLMALLLLASEFKVKGGPIARSTMEGPWDPFGVRMWKTAAALTNGHLSSGINAPLATALHQLDQGADGVLNLITLNCLYGTVTTAVLARALKDRPGIPMLTLIFDGLKKTNEKTRLEAFMEQVHDNFRRRRGSRGGVP
jgi:predicted CoA-substrate-specific enzyme activase